MGITVHGRKLMIDGNRAADDAAYEDAGTYHKDGNVWRFVDLRDADGRIARLAVIRNGRLDDGMSAKAALSRKIIKDEIRSLLDDDYLLTEHCRTDRRTLGLFRSLTEVASQNSRYVPRSEEHTSELQSRFELVCR